VHHERDKQVITEQVVALCVTVRRVEPRGVPVVRVGQCGHRLRVPPDEMSPHLDPRIGDAAIQRVEAQMGGEIGAPARKIRRVAREVKHHHGGAVLIDANRLGPVPNERCEAPGVPVTPAAPAAPEDPLNRHDTRGPADPR
jgi:hypothetical protein